MTINLEIGNQKNADGTIKVYFRITLKRKSKRVDSGFNIDKRYWKKKAGQKRYYMAKGCPEYFLIEKARLDLENKFMSIAAVKSHLDVSGLVKELKLPKKSIKLQNGFFSYGIEHANKIRLENKIGYFKTMLSGLKDFYNFIFREEINSVDFANWEFSNDISFDKINVKLLNDYEHSLRVKGLMTNTIYTKFKILKTIYNKAESEEVFPLIPNPFKRKPLKLAKTKKKALDLSDIIKLENCQLEKTQLNEARNMFLMSFYCAGLRWGDVCTLTWNDVDDDILRITPRKTFSTNASERLIKLSYKALKILDEQGGRKPQSKDAYIFSLINPNGYSLHSQISSKNAVVNKSLKEIALIAEIRASLSFHMARHSFATLALQKNISFAEISQLLGHTDLKTTQIYLKELDNRRIFEAHKSILDY